MYIKTLEFDAETYGTIEINYDSGRDGTTIYSVTEKTREWTKKFTPRRGRVYVCYTLKEMLFDLLSYLYPGDPEQVDYIVDCIDFSATDDEYAEWLEENKEQFPDMFKALEMAGTDIYELYQWSDDINDIYYYPKNKPEDIPPYIDELLADGAVIDVGFAYVQSDDGLH